VLRDEYAQSAAKALQDNSLESVIAAELQMIGDFPLLKSWQLMLDKLSRPCEITPSTKTDGNTRAWLYKSVLPTLKMELKDPEFAKIWYTDLIDLDQ
jgi:hypothetical protein